MIEIREVEAEELTAVQGGMDSVCVGFNIGFLSISYCWGV